jgi:orotate phosphoribosyltransferase
MVHYELLREMIRNRCVHRGKEFTLRSGAKSSLYLDLDPVLYARQGFELVGVVGLSVLYHQIKRLPVADNGEREDMINAVGGPAMAGGQVAAAIMAQCTHYADIRTFVVRDLPKEHGLRERIVGDLRPGDRVLLVDDLATTGGSLGRAKEAVEQVGGVVKAMLVLVDRGVPDSFKAANNFMALYTMKDLGLEQEATLQ